MATVETYLDSEKRAQLTSIVVQAITEFSGRTVHDPVSAKLAKHITDELDDWIGDLVMARINDALDR